MSSKNPLGIKPPTNPYKHAKPAYNHPKRNLTQEVPPTPKLRFRSLPLDQVASTAPSSTVSSMDLITSSFTALRPPSAPPILPGSSLFPANPST